MFYLRWVIHMRKSALTQIIWHPKPEQDTIFYCYHDRSGPTLYQHQLEGVPLNTSIHPESYDLNQSGIVYSDWKSHTLYYKPFHSVQACPFPLSSNPISDIRIITGMIFIIRQSALNSYEILCFDIQGLQSAHCIMRDQHRLLDLQVSPNQRWIAAVRHPYKSDIWSGSQIILLDLSCNRSVRKKRVFGNAERMLSSPRISECQQLLYYLEEGDQHSIIHQVCLMTGTDRSYSLYEGFCYGSQPFLSNLCPLRDDQLVIVLKKNGRSKLHLISFQNDHITMSDLSHPATHIEEIAIDKRGQVLSVGSSATYSPKIFYQSIRKPYIPVPLIPPQGICENQHSKTYKLIQWQGTSGTVNGIFYPAKPQSRSQSPLILLMHNQIHNQVYDTWQAKAQKFNKLGYAVLYVNFRGSIGYGPEYRKSAEGRFGVLEGTDAISGAKYLQDLGLTNGKVAIWGGGTGAYATLQAVINHPNFFSCAVAAFPPLDIEHYLSVSQSSELRYFSKDRSPLSSASKIQTPLACFFNDEDPLIPMEQINRFRGYLLSQRSICKIEVYHGSSSRFEQDEIFDDYQEKVEDFLSRFLLSPTSMS